MHKMTNFIQYLQGGRAYNIWKKKDMLQCFSCGKELDFGDRIVHTVNRATKKAGARYYSKLRCYECAKRLHIIN